MDHCSDVQRLPRTPDFRMHDPYCYRTVELTSTSVAHTLCDNLHLLRIHYTYTVCVLTGKILAMCVTLALVLVNPVTHSTY